MTTRSTRMAVAALATTLGCADFDTPVDPSGGAPDVVVQSPSFATHIAPIFDKRCSLGGCHSFATRQAGLVLEPSAAYEALVGVASALRPELLRVSPTRPAESWLVTMVSSNDAARLGYSRMPLATHPLTPNQIANIVRWIEQGALKN